MEVTVTDQFKELYSERKLSACPREREKAFSIACWWDHNDRKEGLNHRFIILLYLPPIFHLDFNYYFSLISG